MKPRGAVFLDRDGTLIKAIENRPEPHFAGKVTAPFKRSELEFVPHLHEAIGLLRESGFLLIMVTNQPDVANGYLSEAEWEAIHRAVLREADVDDYFVCRCPSERDCFLKKPRPGMLLTAAEKWGIALNSSVIIGDTRYDIGAGKAAGCVTVLLERPYNLDITVRPDHTAPDLVAAARLVVSELQ